MNSQRTPAEKIQMAARMIALAGQDERACHCPVGSPDREIWMEAYRRAKFEEECE